MLVKRRPQRPTKKEHPTKTALINTVVTMLETVPVEEITCDSVLDASGISRGSLYYHFEDFGDLVEHGLAVRFGRYVDESVAGFRNVVEGSGSSQEFRLQLGDLLRVHHDPQSSQHRFERTIPFAAAASSARFRETLGREQQRLTDAEADLIRTAQDRGWVDRSVDPQAVAVLLQATSMGRVVDDVCPSPMSASAWQSLINLVLDRVVLGS
jgi:AcrR family transcriptional regulator